MARFFTIGTINTTKNDGLHLWLKPNYKKGKNDYSALIELYEALGNYLEEQPTNEEGYAVGLGIRLEDAKSAMKRLAQNADLDEDQIESMKHRRRFEKYEVTLVVDD